MILTHLLKAFLGLILVSIGTIGLLIPVMPGWLLIFPGLAMIFPERGKQMARWLKKRAQKISKYFE